MQTRVLIASPRAYGCRAWGGCTPGDRCAEHRGAEPERVGELLAKTLHHIVPARRVHRRPRLRLIRGGRW